MKQHGDGKCLAGCIAAALLAGCGGSDGSGTPTSTNRSPGPPQLPGTVTVDEDASYAGQLSATDPDGDAPSFSVATAPGHGQLTVTSSGALTYVPASNYNGSDQFSVQARDPAGATSVAQFNVTIRAVNDAPVFGGQQLTLTEDTPATSGLAVSDPDGDTFSFALVTPAAHAAVVALGASVTVTPEADFSGTDQFVLRATDANGAGTTATISLVVSGANDVPVAVADRVKVPAGVATVDVLANDTDADGDPLSLKTLVPPQVGSASIVDNRVQYTPAAGFNGPVSIGYRIDDGHGGVADGVAHVVGNTFPRLLYTEDGRFNDDGLWMYDGLRTQRVSFDNGYEVFDFVAAADGRHVIYNARASQSSRGTLRWADLDQLDGALHDIYARQGTTVSAPYMVDRDGSTIVIWDPDPISSASKLQLIEQATTPARASRTLATGADNLFSVSMGTFNPVTSEFYFRAERDTVPATASRYTTLFAGTPAGAGVTQIGSAYTPGAGSGSGIGLRISADGRYVVHAAIDKSPTPIGSLRVSDRLTNTETDLYRAFAAAEFPTPTGFDVDRDGARVCLRVNDAAAPTADGPGRFWVALPAAPGAATAVTPVADTNSTCRWAGSGSRFAYLSSTGAAPKEVWVVDATVPNVVSRAREPLTAGQSTSFFVVAARSTVAVIAIKEASTTHFHRVDLASPGTSQRFASTTATVTEADVALSPNGDWFTYAAPVATPSGTLRQLHQASTTVADFEVLVPLVPESGGVLRFQYVPQP